MLILHKDVYLNLRDTRQPARTLTRTDSWEELRGWSGSPRGPGKPRWPPCSWQADVRAGSARLCSLSGRLEGQTRHQTVPLLFIKTRQAKNSVYLVKFHSQRWK